MSKLAAFLFFRLNSRICSPVSPGCCATSIQLQFLSYVSIFFLFFIFFYKLDMLNSDNKKSTGVPVMSAFIDKMLLL